MENYLLAEPAPRSRLSRELGVATCDFLANLTGCNLLAYVTNMTNLNHVTWTMQQDPVPLPPKSLIQGLYKQ